MATWLFVILSGGHLTKACCVCDFARRAFEEGMFCYCLECGTKVVVHLW